MMGERERKRERERAHTAREGGPTIATLRDRDELESTYGRKEPRARTAPDGTPLHTSRYRGQTDRQTISEIPSGSRRCRRGNTIKTSVSFPRRFDSFRVCSGPGSNQGNGN